MGRRAKSWRSYASGFQRSHSLGRHPAGNGIDRLDPADLKYAWSWPHQIRSPCVLVNDRLEIYVSPNLAAIGRPLSEVRQVHNAVMVVGDAVGRLFSWSGVAMPTALAVVADLIDTVTGRPDHLPHRPVVAAGTRELANHSCRGRWYYLRFAAVADHPGVLAEICGVLGRHCISIASVIQHEATADLGGYVPLVIMIYAATEGGGRVGGITDRLPVQVRRGMCGREFWGPWTMKYAIVIP
ncbi:MAG: ACT domain-containing protein [Pirellulales bacterium]